jgi:tetratricopeptide (TPR) repeat protein
MAHKLSPDFAPAMDSRGFVYLRLGAYERAIRDYDDAIRLQAGYASAYFGRGLARLHLARVAEGRADIVKARALDPRIETLFASAGVTGKGLPMPPMNSHKGKRKALPPKPEPLPSGTQQVQNRTKDGAGSMKKMIGWRP